MIIRVKIHVNTLERDDCERIFINSVKFYTDEQEACRATDEILSNPYQLNGGCTLSGSEDFIALNAMLAERFNDPYNADAYAEWDDITEEVIIKCSELFCEHQWSGDMLLRIANDIGIDLSELY